MKNVAITLGIVAVLELGFLGYVSASRAFGLSEPGGGPVVFNCMADNDSIDCTFTNTARREWGSMCVGGSLSLKDGGGKIDSLPVCSGRVGPRETKVASGPWIGAFAKDLCFSETNAIVGRQLDWSKCKFSSKELP